ncbi:MULTISPECIES: hypothetical protein [unclassified Microcoleus]|uniref:hypothetical protein n=1 Tax=unclassified Microcoleus TaxID=2642155 RepID=UPI002FD2ADA2
MTPPGQKSTVRAAAGHSSAKCCNSLTEMRSRRQDISLSPLSKILKQPQHPNPISSPIICFRRQWKILSQQRCIAFSTASTNTDHDFSSRILHDRLAVSQLPTTSNRSTLIVPTMLAILQGVPTREQQAAKAVRLKARVLAARVMGGEPNLTAPGWESEIRICFLLDSAIEGEFLRDHFGSIDLVPGCYFLALYCLYLILNRSINHEADRDRLLFLDLV